MASYVIKVEKPLPWISTISTVAPVGPQNSHFWEIIRGDPGYYSDRFHATPDETMTLECETHNKKYYCSLFLERDGTAADNGPDNPNRRAITVETDDKKSVGMPGLMTVTVKRGNAYEGYWESDGTWRCSI
jgi:hypothetical protein